MIVLSSLMKNVKGNFILQDSLIYQPSLPHLFTKKHYRFWTDYPSRARLYIQKQIMRLRSNFNLLCIFQDEWFKLTFTASITRPS